MSTTKARPVVTLQVADLTEFPVWQFTAGGRSAEPLVRPVKRIPVSSLSGRLVGTRVALAGGQRVWALLGNVDTANPRLTEQFVTLSLERAGKWFHLARYHDFDYASRGPGALAEFLELAIDDVFPMRYDIRAYAEGQPGSLVGVILKEPRERLTRAEIIGLAVP